MNEEDEKKVMSSIGDSETTEISSNDHQPKALPAEQTMSRPLEEEKILERQCDSTDQLSGDSILLQSDTVIRSDAASGISAPNISNTSADSELQKSAHLENLENLENLEAIAFKRDATYAEINYGFTFYIPYMVDNVYHYNVKIEPKRFRSKKLRHLIFMQFIANDFPSMNIAFDGVQFAYAPQRLDTSKLQFKTKFIHPESKKERELLVTLQEENDCEIPFKQALRDYLNNPESTEPTRAVKAFTTILHDIVISRYGCSVPIYSLSFFAFPTGVNSLLWFYCHRLWGNFRIKKKSIWSPPVEPPQNESIVLEDILAEYSSSTPNDKDIEEKLSRMTMSDYVDAAEKSPKFQEIAKKYFPTEILYIYDDMRKYCDRLSSFLRIFGHLIKSIIWRRENQTQSDEYFKMIAKFCGKSVIKLDIKSYDFNSNDLSQFRVLEDLSIANVSLDKFEPIPSLKRLLLFHVNLKHFDCLSQTFPKLEYIGLSKVHGLKDDMIIEFQRVAPQLHEFFLNLDQCDDNPITSSIFKGIGTRTPNIEILKCRFGFHADDELEVNALHLSELRKLKHLEITGTPVFSAKQLINLLAKKVVPIKYLEVYNAEDVIENLPKLKQVKTVEVFSCSEETLIKSIKKTPTLERIYVRYLRPATVPGILQILENIRDAKLTLGMDELSIDSNEYNSILALVKDHHLKVDLSFKDGDIDVSDDVVQANRSWLDIII